GTIIAAVVPVARPADRAGRNRHRRGARTRARGAAAALRDHSVAGGGVLYDVGADRTECAGLLPRRVAEPGAVYTCRISSGPRGCEGRTDSCHSFPLMDKPMTVRVLFFSVLREKTGRHAVS